MGTGSWLLGEFKACWGRAALTDVLECEPDEPTADSRAGRRARLQGVPHSDVRPCCRGSGARMAAHSSAPPARKRGSSCRDDDLPVAADCLSVTTTGVEVRARENAEGSHFGQHQARKHADYRTSRSTRSMMGAYGSLSPSAASRCEQRLNRGAHLETSSSTSPASRFDAGGTRRADRATATGTIRAYPTLGNAAIAPPSSRASSTQPPRLVP